MSSFKHSLLEQAMSPQLRDLSASDQALYLLLITLAPAAGGAHVRKYAELAPALGSRRADVDEVHRNSDRLRRSGHTLEARELLIREREEAPGRGRAYQWKLLDPTPGRELAPLHPGAYDWVLRLVRDWMPKLGPVRTVVAAHVAWHMPPTGSLEETLDELAQCLPASRNTVKATLEQLAKVEGLGLTHERVKVEGVRGFRHRVSLTLPTAPPQSRPLPELRIDMSGLPFPRNGAALVNVSSAGAPSTDGVNEITRPTESTTDCGDGATSPPNHAEREKLLALLEWTQVRRVGEGERTKLAVEVAALDGRYGEELVRYALAEVAASLAAGSSPRKGVYEWIAGICRLNEERARRRSLLPARQIGVLTGIEEVDRLIVEHRGRLLLQSRFATASRDEFAGFVGSLRVPCGHGFEQALELAHRAADRRGQKIKRVDLLLDFYAPAIALGEFWAGDEELLDQAYGELLDGDDPVPAQKGHTGKPYNPAWSKLLALKTRGLADEYGVSAY